MDSAAKLREIRILLKKREQAVGLFFLPFHLWLQTSCFQSHAFSMMSVSFPLVIIYYACVYFCVGTKGV